MSWNTHSTLVHSVSWSCLNPQGGVQDARQRAGLRCYLVAGRI